MSKGRHGLVKHARDQRRELRKAAARGQVFAPWEWELFGLDWPWLLP